MRKTGGREKKTLDTGYRFKGYNVGTNIEKRIKGQE